MYTIKFLGAHVCDVRIESLRAVNCEHAPPETAYSKPHDARDIGCTFTRKSCRRLMRDVEVHLQPAPEDNSDADHDPASASVRLLGLFALNRRGLRSNGELFKADLGHRQQLSS